MGGEYFDWHGGAISHDEFVQFLGEEFRYVPVQKYFLAFMVNIFYLFIFYMSLSDRGHSMDDIVKMLDIQGEDSDCIVTCFVKLFYPVEY